MSTQPQGLLLLQAQAQAAVVGGGREAPRLAAARLRAARDSGPASASELPGVSTALPPLFTLSAASSLPGLKDRGDGRGERSWVALARAHAPQYAGLLVLLLLLAASEAWHPFRRNLYVGETPDLELWRYSYPLKANHVPAWAVPCVAVSVPCALIAAWLLAGRMSRAEAHAALLIVLYCVATTGTLTNWVKCEVRRRRWRRREHASSRRAFCPAWPPLPSPCRPLPHARAGGEAAPSHGQPLLAQRRQARVLAGGPPHLLRRRREPRGGHQELPIVSELVKGVPSAAIAELLLPAGRRLAGSRAAQ